MSVKHGIMGLLKREDAHGYELQARFNRIAGENWPVKQPQFYSTLERLEQQGLVDKVQVPQENRPDRKVYSLTDEGCHKYYEWLTSADTNPRTLRDEFFLKATFALEEDPVVAGKLFTNQRKALLNLLHQLQGALSGYQGTGDMRLILLTKGAILHAEADLKWLEQFEQVLEDRE